MTDRQLIDRYLQDRSQDALADLVSRHVNMVHATARQHSGDDACADDITQAVFLLLLRRAAALPAEASIAGWLYKTTWYVASEMRRQNRRRLRREREAHAMAAGPPSSADPDSQPVAAALSGEQRTALYAAIARLPAAERDVIILTCLEGRPSAEVAALHQTTEVAIRARLTRARQRLRKFLSRSGIALSAPTLAATLETVKAQAAPAATLTQVHAILGGAVPAAHIQSLVTGIISMTLRTKQLALAVVLFAVAFALGFLIIATGGNHTQAPPQPPNAAAPPTATSTQPAALRNTPKSAVLAAYHDALAGDEENFLAHFAGLSDDGNPVPPSTDQAAILRAVVRGMHAVDLLTSAIGDKFGAQAQAEFARQMPTYIDAAALENATVLEIDASHALVDMGETGPKNVPVVCIAGDWRVDPSVLATLNAAEVRKVDAQIEQINALTGAIKAGRFADMQSLQTAVAGALGTQAPR